MDKDSPLCPPDIETPRPRYSSDERPIITLGAAMDHSESYTAVDEEVQFRRRPSHPEPRAGPSYAGPVGSASGLRRGEEAGMAQMGVPGFVPMGSPAYGFRPEPYDGEGDWSEYLVAFEQYADYMRWDGRTKATMLGFCLRGPARSVLAGLPEASRSDYRALKEALTQNFSPREQLHLYQAELKSRQRKPGESLTSLGRDIARMVRFAYPTADDGTRETIGINAFLDALPGSAMEIRLHVVKGRPRTLQQAVAYAMEVDAVLEAEARRGHAPRRGNVKVTEDADASTLSQLRVELQRALDQMRAEMERKKKRDSLKDVTCFRCGKKGHMKKDCRVPEEKIKRQGNAGERQPKTQ